MRPGGPTGASAPCWTGIDGIDAAGGVVQPGDDRRPCAASASGLMGQCHGRARGRPPGADDHLSKPLWAQALFQALAGIGDAEQRAAA